MSSKAYRVVLVEDNPVDVMMITRALQQEATCEVTVFSDGEQAYRFFENGAEGEDAPELVVLDLNLPVRDGTEILDLIRSHPELGYLRVAVVSSSPEDVMKGRTAQADCYITKPPDLDEYLAVGKRLLGCIQDQGCGNN